MTYDRGKPSRHELTETKDRHSDTMGELRLKLEAKAQDLTTVRRLLEELDLDGGMAEGAEAIEQSVNRAEEVTETLFDQDDSELDSVHGEGESFQSDVTGIKETSDRNLGRLTDITAPLETRETIDRIREGKEAALHDIDFLQNLMDRALESLQESEQVQKDLRDIRSGGG